ncbi:MAG: transporter [Thermodesulfovibrionales bacterium]
MRKKLFRIIASLVVCASAVLSTAPVFAAHPLVTDDTGTQGRGKFQLEVNTEVGWDRDREDGITVKETSGEVSATFSAGLHDRVDLVLGVPYHWYHVKENDDTVAHNDGNGDISLEVKWRFYEEGGLSLALKPGITIPTGSVGKGLGAGRVGYGAFFITQWENEPWTFLVNLGYLRNENRVDERKDIWHGSFAVEREVVKDLKLVANAGLETDPDPAQHTPAAFGIAGLIYSITENVDVDFGIKTGLSRPETDFTLLAGIAWRF